MNMILILCIIFTILGFKDIVFTKRQYDKKLNNASVRMIENSKIFSSEIMKYVSYLTYILVFVELSSYVIASIKIDIFEIYLITIICILSSLYNLMKIDKIGLLNINSDTMPFNYIKNYILLFFTLIYKPMIIILLILKIK